jgi:hypothetical protein
LISRVPWSIAAELWAQAGGLGNTLGNSQPKSARDEQRDVKESIDANHNASSVCDQQSGDIRA